jgi:hypothetical protein
MSSLTPLRGFVHRFAFYPRLAPWAAFLRRFAAGAYRRSYSLSSYFYFFYFYFSSFGLFSFSGEVCMM